jgi:Na+-driven multidrug efflux pump
MLISQTTTLIAMLVLLYRRKHFLCIRRHELHYLRIDKDILKVLVLRGVPMGLQMIIVSSSMLAMLGLINQFGTDTTAAFGAAMQLWTYIQMPAFAVGSAVTIMAAQSIGAGNWDRLGKVTWAALGINAALTGGMIVLVYLFNHTAVGFFLPHGSPAVAIATHINAIVLWSFVLFGGTLVLMGVVRATGAVIGPLVMLFVSMWVVRIPFAYAVAPRWQADAIWWSFPLGSIVALLMGWLYYQYGGWRKIQIMPHTKVSAPQPVEG